MQLRSTLIFGFVMYLALVNADVTITNTGVDGYNFASTVTLTDPVTAGKGVMVNLNVSMSELTYTRNFPIACFANTVDNVLNDGQVLQGFVLQHEGMGFPTSIFTSQVIIDFLSATLTMTAEGNLDFASTISSTDNLEEVATVYDWSGGYLSYSYEMDQAFADNAGLNSSISAAIWIFCNDHTFDVGNQEWGTADEASVNLNQYATIVYWTCSPGQCGEENGNGGIDGISGRDIGGQKIFATFAVAGVTTLAFGMFLSIF